MFGTPTPGPSRSPTPPPQMEPLYERLHVTPLDRFVGHVERRTKATGKWVRRFFTLEGRILSYASSSASGTVTRAIELTKCVRAAEHMMEAPKHEQDSFILLCSGIPTKTKAKLLRVDECDGEHAATWTLRCQDQDSFKQWYDRCNSVLASVGLCQRDPFFALPSVDPRTELPLVEIPLPYLGRFNKLSSRTIFSFSKGVEMPCSCDRIVVAGDTHLYVCNPDASVQAMMALPTLQRVMWCKLSSTGDYVIGFQAEEDFIFRFKESIGAQILKVLPVLKKYCCGKTLSIDPCVITLLEQVLSPPPTRVTPLGPLFLPTEMSALLMARQSTTTSSALTVSNSCESYTIEKCGRVARILRILDLSEYEDALQRRAIDWQVLRCLTASDLRNCGVLDENHCERILRAARDPHVIEALLQQEDGGLGMDVEYPLTPEENSSLRLSFCSPPPLSEFDYSSPELRASRGLPTFHEDDGSSSHEEDESALVGHGAEATAKTFPKELLDLI